MSESTLHVPLAEVNRLGRGAGEVAAKLSQVQSTIEIFEW